MRERFMENETDIYTVLYNAMVSIDAPKTLYFPDQDDMAPIDEKYKKQAYFLQYKIPEEDVVPKIYTGKVGLLDMASEYIEEYLLEPIKENRSSFEGNEGLLMQMLINGDYEPDKFDIYKSEIEALYKNYTEIREKIAKEKRKKIRNEMRNKEELIDNCIWDKYDEWDYQFNIKKIQDTAYLKYKETDKEYIVKAEEIMGKYTLPTVANAIGTLKNCTEDFILNLFIPVLEVMHRQSTKDRFLFQKTDNVQEADITYLYEHYKKIMVTTDNNASIVANLQREEKKRLQVTDLNHEFRARILGDGTLKLLEKEFAEKKYIFCGVEVDNGQVFLSYEEERILEVFKEWYQIEKYSLLKAKDIRIDGIINVAPKGTSLKMVTTSITVEE